jgi:hypothetical protein
VTTTDEMASTAKNSWLIELDGEAAELMALTPIAPACNCTMRPGPDGQLWLGGARFDDMSTPEEALEEARKALGLLNGLARLENQKHRAVGLGETANRNGQRAFTKPGRGSPPPGRGFTFSNPSARCRIGNWTTG